MKPIYAFCLCLLSFAGFGQQPVYKNFEVDSAAVPRGGMNYLTTFLQANLRKPVQAESEGIGGRVLVQGIVEPDGHITDVTVLKSFRPDLDREALRVFGLFNAWQPAQKGGTAVRQMVMLPIVFAKNTPFPFVDGKRSLYYDTDGKLTDDPVKAKYKQEMPLDSVGIPNGEMVVYEQGRKGWTVANKISLTRQKSTLIGPAGTQIESVGYKNTYNLWFDYVYDFTGDRTLIRKTLYDDGKPVGYPLQYHSNGVLEEISREEDGRTFYTSWYANGQIRQIRYREEQPSGKDYSEQVINYWAPNGRQYVSDGNGKVIVESIRQSSTDSTRRVRYIEQGEYAFGKKQGLWTGHYDDDSFNYEELYDKGTLQSGKSRRGQREPVTYTLVEKQPEFQGGMQGLGQFLGSNLQYPIDAQRSRQQGRVFVSFVVCTDGTLCDYAVIKGVSPSIDREALRVVKSMSGKWKPGLQRGEPVRVKYNLPINFSIN